MKPTTAKPETTAAADAPEFVANIDTANEEIVRLTGELATSTLRAETAEGALASVSASMAKMVKPEDHQAVVAAKALVDSELATAKAKIVELGATADTAATNATAAIAAAAITAPAQVKGANELADDAGKVTGLTGLARAIAANKAQQAKA